MPTTKAAPKKSAKKKPSQSGAGKGNSCSRRVGTLQKQIYKRGQLMVSSMMLNYDVADMTVRN